MGANSLKLQVILDTVDKVTGKFKAINESSTRLSRTLRATRDNLKALEAQQGQLAKHRDLETRTAATAQKMLAQQRALRALQNAYNATENPTKKLTKELREQSAATAKLVRLEQAQRGELVQSRAALAAAGLGTDKLAHHQDRLAHEITASTRQIDKQKAALDKLGAAQKRAAGWQSSGAAMTVKGAAAFAGGSMALQRMGEATMPGVQLQSQVRDIAITGGFNPQQEAALNAQIRGDAVKFGQTTEVISQGLQVLVANGVSSAEDLRYYSGLLAKSSVASGAEVEDLSNLMVSLQQNLGLTREQMPGAIDALAYAGKQGSFELRDMAKWMPTLTPMMASLGVHGRDAVNQLGAALQVAKLGAGSTDEAGNNLKNFLMKISSPETLGNFKRVGIDLKKRLMELQAQGIAPMEGSLQLITEYMGKKGPEALKSLRAAMSLKDDEERQQALQRVAEAYALGDLFRDQQAAAFIRPALEHGDQLKSIQQGAAGASGVLDADYIKRMKSAQKKLDMFQIKLTELKLKAFDALEPSLTTLADKAGVLFDKIGAFVADNPELASLIIKVAAGFALLLVAAGSVLVPLGFLASTIGTIMEVAGTLSGALEGAGIAASSIAAPLLLVAGIGLLIWKYWDYVKALLSGFWDGFVEAMQPVMPALDMLADTFNKIMAPASASKETLAKFAAVGKFIGKVFGAQLSVVLVVLAIALQTVANVFKWVGEFIGNTIGFIVTGLGNLWDVISGIFSGDWGQVMAGLRGNWENINQYFGGLPAKFLQYGIDIVKGLINGITSMYGAAKKAIGGLGDAVIGFFTGPKQLDIHSPSRTFARFGHFTIAGFTQGLLGGESGAQQALGRIGNGLRTTAAGIAIGTAGMATAGNAVPLDMRPAMAAGTQAGGAPTYNITINAPAGAQAQDIAALVRAEIERLEHRRATGRRAALSDYD
ncbi:phage tail tape measure protein [Thermomonas sp.]|uniref:phage tail tape measure protein n=1 Tax=Thermomonas sp. TaxID=1971895 RepID=UPI0035B2067B